MRKTALLLAFIGSYCLFISQGLANSGTQQRSTPNCEATLNLGEGTEYEPGGPWIGYFDPTPQFRQDMERLREIKKLSSEERKKAFLSYAEPPRLPSWKKAGMLIDYALASVMAVQITLGLVDDPMMVVPTLAAIPAALWSADFIGQAFHKWLDSYASENSKIWGPSARAFRQHHEVPTNLNHASYLTHGSDIAFILAPAFAAATLAPTDPATGTALWVMLVSLLNATEIHKQAHRGEKAQGVFKLLQKARLTIDHDDHMAHHRPPFASDYGVINGWSHPATRYFKLWDRLDLIWWKAYKKLPNNWIQDARAIPPEVVAELQNDLSLIPDELVDAISINPKWSTEEINELVRRKTQQFVSLTDG